MQRALVVRTQGGNFDCNQISKLAINSVLFPGVAAVSDTHSRTPVISCPCSQLVLTDDGFAAHRRGERKSSSSSTSFIGKLPSSACSWKSVAAQHLRLHTLCTAVVESVLHIYSCWCVFILILASPSQGRLWFPVEQQPSFQLQCSILFQFPLQELLDLQLGTASCLQPINSRERHHQPRDKLSSAKVSWIPTPLSLSLSRFMMSSCW